MTHISIVVISIVLQLLAAGLVLRLIPLTKHRAAWFCVALALVLMVIRRIFPLLPAYETKEPFAWHVYDFVGLAVSASILTGMYFMHRYLGGTLAAERCLYESEQRYRSLAQNIPNSAVFLFDRDNRYTLAEGSLLEQMSIHREHFGGRNSHQISLPDDLEQIFSPLKEAALEGSAGHIQQAYQGRIYSLHFLPFTGMDRAISGGMLMASDISEQLENERLRNAAYDFLQKTIDGVAEPVMVIGLDYQVKLMNRVVRDSYMAGPGSSPPPCYALSHHRNAPCCDEAHPCPLQLVRETLLPATVLHEHRTSNGATRLVEIMASPLFDDAGQLQGIIEAARDITERRRAEEALRESESILRTFLEDSEDAVMLANEQGMTLHWSRGAEALTGYSRDETLGMPIWDVLFRSVPDEIKSEAYLEQIKATIHAYMHEGKGRLLNLPVETQVERPDGIHLTVQSLAFAIPTDKGFLLGAILRNITDRKQDETELLMLRKAVDAAGEVIFLTDRDGLITFINAEFTRLYGYTADEVVGKCTPRVLKSGVMGPEKYAQLWQRILGGQVVKGEIVNRTKDGRLVNIGSSINPVLDENGEIEGFLAIQQDITERTRVESEKNRLLHAIQWSLDGIAIADENDCYINEKRAHAKTPGLPEGELIGKTWRILVPKEAEQPIETAFREQLRNTDVGFVFADSMGRKKDGSLVPVEFRAKALWDQEGRYAGHICSVVDITRRKHAEEITHRRTEELETLMMVSTAMRTARTRLEISQVILDQLTTILESQAAALTLLDSGSGEILVELGYGDWRDWTGTRLAANQPGMVCPLASMQPYQHRGASDSIPSLHPQLTNKLPCVTSVPLIANEQPIGALWIGRTSPFAQENMQLLEAIRDMAANAIQRQTLNENLQTQLEALRSMQARLVQNEKLAAVGQLVSGVAHELNNPLTSVMLYSQMAQHTELDELTRQNLTKVVSEARRAGKIVRGLLDFARQRPPRRETIQVNEVLRLSLDLVAYELRAHNIELEVHLSPDLPKISADPHQLQQVFVNLIQNAWHAMDLAWGGGHLTIWTEVGRSKFWTSPDQAGQMVRVCVKDDGPGIAPENISRIFDPFFTTMPEGSGTGLGLSICHGIITEHAGYIWAESPAGQGASLFIELPVGAAPQAAVSESSSATDLLDSSTEKYRILVMDDEPNISAVLAQALQRAEYLVDAVSSGTEGLSRIKDLEYDAIVCDIRMPGFSGLDFYREVEKHDPRLLDRIIFITGDTVNSATRKFIEEKRARYLAKPFEMGDLFNIIKTVLAS